MHTTDLPMGLRRPVKLSLLAILALLMLLVGSVAGASAAGGTDKPPPGAVAPFVTPTLPDPAFSTDPANIHGFDDTGFIQTATVSGAACPNVTDPANFGGTVTLNNLTITVPCNTVLQMPANTLSWVDFVKGITHALPDTTFPTLPVELSNSLVYASFEIHVIGNLVGTAPAKRIAGLIFVSQQSFNGSTGVISKIDYATGNLHVATPSGPAVVQINDPKGRFGRVQSPDERFSVDDANPTIHAATGYPMCVPRVTDDPTAPGATADDPLCPQQNRPTAPGCRNFSQAGVAPPNAGELTPTPAVAGKTVYCTQYVMPTAPTDPKVNAPGADARQQAPFEVGDTITYSGTLIHDPADPTKDYISAHTIEANLGIYTQPGKQPAYMAIGEFGVGTADPTATAVNGAAQETQDRVFLEAETTDVKTPVDIYMMDVDPATGDVHNRWVTPYEMTGENQNGDPSGGMTTQDTGPQPQRARIRATKAPAGILSAPSRTMRVVQRTLCPPPHGNVAVSQVLDDCLNNAPTVANGLVAGQYVAPTFEFIFPENVRPGDAVVPNDFWHLPFLRTSESPAGAPGLDPAPW